ncbi:MAG: hypothetical protein N4A48_14090 [Tepidibacter sp.]|jgi:hypothetical protein|uniref:hypothetical protein n=1 Tax=Tepidibacter sp. TaxID=2529387 RepID=UPI0025DEA8DF|nr:hypothetical protein [Tepidibacter sp.]MCT4509859.1 hypothetical protein [Tepidibacter sp.]
MKNSIQYLIIFSLEEGEIMENSEFLGYIGSYKMHDGRIKKIIQERDKLKVIVESYDKEMIFMEFYGVKEINSFNPEDMILYGVCEMKTQEPFREFRFLNWYEEREEYLEVIVMGYKK